MTADDSKRVALYRTVFPEHAFRTDEQVSAVLDKLTNDKEYADAWIETNYIKIRRANYEELYHAAFT